MTKIKCAQRLLQFACFQIHKLILLQKIHYIKFQRLVSNSYVPAYKPTTTKGEYFPSLVLETSILECRLVDLPVINKFPTSSEEEWQNYRHFGLRSADAYLLVYDVTTPSSFRFIQFIREQIAMSRGLGEVPIVVAANKTDLVKDDLAKESDRETSRLRHDSSTKVKKAWKLNHVECSAKYNWNITTVFRELAAEILEVRNRNNGGNGKVETEECCLVCMR